jgi:predicted DNA-binding transcriptional regulator YafY
MKADMQRTLAREPFEKKIAKTEQLIRLAKEFPRRQMSARQKNDLAKEEAIISAIRNRSVLEFSYSGQPRIVEPQTYGISTAGHPILRGYQRGGGSSSGYTKGLRLFEGAKISRLRRRSEQFAQARPEHNPNDNAMSKVIISLPRPKQQRSEN